MAARCPPLPLTHALLWRRPTCPASGGLRPGRGRGSLLGIVRVVVVLRPAVMMAGGETSLHLGRSHTSSPQCLPAPLEMASAWLGRQLSTHGNATKEHRIQRAGMSICEWLQVWRGRRCVGLDRHQDCSQRQDEEQRERAVPGGPPAPGHFIVLCLLCAVRCACCALCVLCAELTMRFIPLATCPHMCKTHSAPQLTPWYRTAHRVPTADKPRPQPPARPAAAVHQQGIGHHHSTGAGRHLPLTAAHHKCAGALLGASGCQGAGAPVVWPSSVCGNCCMPQRC